MNAKSGRLPASVARLRNAVRASLADCAAGDLVLVACSGGPDSLALADAAVFVTGKLQMRLGLVTVDHQLQEGSDVRAKRVAEWAHEQGMDPVEVETVDVGRAGGPEAAARDARYAALTDSGRRHHAKAILLGHTRDDQAETVLLALARGAGPRGLAGMPAISGVYRRPLLDIPRADTVDACARSGLEAWEDPHNSDPRFRRSRLRGVMDTLTQTLGEGLVDNLARSARLIASDNSYLDEQAAAMVEKAVIVPFGLSVTVMEELPEALRTRVIHVWLREVGVPGGALAHKHVAAVDALITDWKGQGDAAMPGRIFVQRKGRHLLAVYAAEGLPKVG
ncbi:tRNA lysidine(34) synthetase TilS [Natronoglycomyces albus]|uniref:tRNA(Ile)-lysidine synthase n=1 Tax=Natronoglycomyces albus TaxID=2811108 RepID=A0A895XGS1_9ACTN|nr:tRNA lysidine(34) synthetase TilS [Natronoglycomyces albus]QSB05051.1 tRNA lysidine(34) synthetase TilS [Natronoglycomyces albus]